MATKKVLKKIIKNGVEYYLPENGGGGGGDLDINEVNGLIDIKVKDSESIFQNTSGLYKILNDIDNTDELGLTSGDDWEEIVEDDNSMNKISHSYAVMCYVASSEYAMSKILEDSSATDEISECWNSISIIAENSKANPIYIESDNGFDHLMYDEIVQDAFFTNEEVKNKILSDNVIRIVNNNDYLENFYQEPGVVNAIANNSEALLIISSNSDKLAIIIDSTAITTAISNNSSCLNAIASDSDCLEVCKNTSSIMNNIATTSAVNSMSDSDFSEYILKNSSYLNSTLGNTYGTTKIKNMGEDGIVDSVSYYAGVSGFETFDSLIADDTAIVKVIKTTNSKKIIAQQFDTDYKLWTRDGLLNLDYSIQKYCPLVLTVQASVTFTFKIPVNGYGSSSYNWIFINNGNRRALSGNKNTTARTYNFSSTGTKKILIKYGGDEYGEYPAGWLMCLGCGGSSSRWEIGSSYTMEANTVPGYGFMSSASSIQSYYMAYTFYGNTKLTKVNLGSYGNINPNTYYLLDTFYSCTNLSDLGSSRLICPGASQIANGFMNYTFYNCSNLLKLPSGFNLGSVFASIGSEFMYQAFYGCSKLRSLPTGFKLPTVGNSSSYMYRTFYNCTALGTSSPTENLTFTNAGSNTFYGTSVTPVSPSAGSIVAVHRE